MLPRTGVRDGATGLRWNGTAWKPVPVPGFRRASALLGVTALSARDVWAVVSTVRTSAAT